MILSFPNNALQGNIELPSSKSISNRVLMIQALCKKKFEIENLSDANDTKLLQHLLTEIEKNTDEILVLNCEDAGTPFRFLVSFLAIQENRNFILQGSERLMERPIQELVEALQSIGADIQYSNQKGFGPLVIHGKKLVGGRISIRGDISSQFISSLCLLAPCLQHGLEIEITKERVSDNYVEMTLNIMKDFGIDIQENGNSISIKQHPYVPLKLNETSNCYEIENDWSSACFFYAMAMMNKHVDLQFPRLQQRSLQGDTIIAELAKDFGIQTSFTETSCSIIRIEAIDSSLEKKYELSNYPDLAIPFIVACAVRYPHISISGIHHLEWKESKRITALQIELKKIDIHLHYENDLLTFENKTNNTTPTEVFFHTYNDHRIAMALSMLNFVGYEVSLDNTDCVKKSFPNFFQELEKLNVKK